MFKWSYSEKVMTNATAEQVWAIWEQPELWPSWDSELTWVKLDGPFKSGTKGKMQPVGGPIVEFTLTEVKVNRRFVDRTRLPLTNMEFSHFYELDDDKKWYCFHTSQCYDDWAARAAIWFYSWPKDKKTP